MLLRRLMLAAVLAGGSLAGLYAGTAAAQDYPTKPIRFVVPYPAGGPTDILGRVLGQKLNDAWGQAVVVDNRPGAGGNLGSDMVAKAAPDGYTIGLGNNATHATNASLYQKMPFDTVADFIPVGLVASVTNVVVVHPSLPVKSVAELVAYAKERPGQLNYASTGSGSAAHLIGELFKISTGTDIVHVPYRGSAPAVTDLLSGQVTIMFATLPTVLPHIQASKLVPLATTGSARNPLLPQVPTAGEAGLAGFEADAWFGVFVPAKTPRPIVDKLNAEIRRALAMADVKEKLAQQGFDVATSSPDEFQSFIKAEIAKWGKVVQVSGAKVE